MSGKLRVPSLQETLNTVVEQRDDARRDLARERERTSRHEIQATIALNNLRDIPEPSLAVRNAIRALDALAVSSSADTQERE